MNTLTHAGYYHPGIAVGVDVNGFPVLSVAYQVHLDWTTGLTEIKRRNSANLGSTWLSPVQLMLGSAPVTTASPGISQSFNPATGQFIAVWRHTFQADNARIYYHHGTGGSAWHDTAARTIDTPAIACGPTSVVGARNCLLAWSDAKSWGGIVKWQQCSVATNNTLSNCSPIRTHGYYSAGSPSVTYVNDIAYPWQIALNQGGAGIYTWRKAAADTASFGSQRSFSYSPQAVLPAAGTARNSGSNRRYIFTMDE